MVQRARVRWAMGSSVSFSVVFLVSVGGMMSTLGDELVGVCMNCTLVYCRVEEGRGVVCLMTTCIIGFVCAFPVGSLVGSMGALFSWGYVGTFLVQCPKILWRALIARSCSSHILIGASSSVHVSVCRPWRTRSSGVRVGCDK